MGDGGAAGGAVRTKICGKRISGKAKQTGGRLCLENTQFVFKDIHAPGTPGRGVDKPRAEHLRGNVAGVQCAQLDANQRPAEFFTEREIRLLRRRGIFCLQAEQALCPVADQMTAAERALIQKFDSILRLHQRVTRSMQPENAAGFIHMGSAPFKKCAGKRVPGADGQN